MKTYALYICPSDPHHKTGKISHTIMYSDGCRRGFWTNKKKAIKALLSTNKDIFDNKTSFDA